MATQDSTAAPVFFPHLAGFTRAQLPDVLTTEQLARIERGELHYGESVIIQNLNSLAEEWTVAREAFERGAPGSMSAAELDECAWYFVRIRRGFTGDGERANLETLRSEIGKIPEGRA